VRTVEATDAGPTSTDRWIVLALSAVLLVIAVVTQVAAWRVEGLWNDEYYTLFVSDPSLSPADLATALVSDTNPPLFYAVVAAVRQVWDGTPRLLFLLINAAVLAAVFVVVAVGRDRPDRVLVAFLATAALMAGGMAHYYFLEGRAYFLTSSICFLLGLHAFDVAIGALPARAWILAMAGAAAALGHVYGGLVSGSIAAGLLAVALLYRRRELVAPALALGIAATLVTVIWVAWAWRFTDRVDWIYFTPNSIKTYARETLLLAVGSKYAVYLLVAVGLAALAHPRTRAMAIVLLVATALVFALPVAASFRQPIIQPRYWMVAAPLVPAFLVALIVVAGRIGGVAGSGLRVAAAGTLLLTSVLAAFQTHVAVAGLPYWRGTAPVVEFDAECPPGSIRIWISGRPEYFPEFYAIASGFPLDRFVVVSPKTPAPPWTPSGCPIVAWVEHYPEDQPTRDVTDPDVARTLLEAVGLPPDPSRFVIEPHHGDWEGGYVVRERK
jgi:hypothetical protein